MGSSSIPDEVEDIEEQPLVRNRIRYNASTSIDSPKDIPEVNNLTSPSSPPHHQPQPQNNGNEFHEVSFLLYEITLNKYNNIHLKINCSGEVYHLWNMMKQ